MKDNMVYGSASLGDALAYNFISSYFMFFLTTVAGVKPGIAGTITMIGALWNALINPVVGYCADQIQTRFGRRRPVILFFTIPLALAILLSFTSFPLPASVKPFYYGLCLMLFWLSYTGYFVPYLALGVDYTSDYDQRTVLRLFASMFNMVGSLVAFLLPSVLVEFLMSQGCSRSQAWSVVAGLVGLVAAASIIVTVLLSGHKDQPCGETKLRIRIDLIRIFREFFSIAMLKPMRTLVIASVASLISIALFMADMVYFLTFNLGYSPVMISLFLALRPVFGFLQLPVTVRLALHLDKKPAYNIIVLTGVVCMCLLRLHGVNSIPETVLYMLFLSICSSTYWQLIPSVYYDVCDYDRLISGKSRDASVLSFQGLVEAIAAGLGNLILGLLLGHGGFDGAATVQSQAAMDWIFNCTTLVPCAFLIIAVIAIWRYPISREVHEEIMEKLEAEKTDA